MAFPIALSPGAKLGAQSNLLFQQLRPSLDKLGAAIRSNGGRAEHVIIVSHLVPIDESSPDRIAPHWVGSRADLRKCFNSIEEPWPAALDQPLERGQVVIAYFLYDGYTLSKFKPLLLMGGNA